MRHLTCVHQFRTRHAHEAPDIVVGFTDGRIARVDDRYTIHIESIAIRPRLDGPQGYFPNPVGVLYHGPSLIVPRNIAPGKPHSLCLWSVDAKCDVPISRHFRRDNLPS